MSTMFIVFSFVCYNLKLKELSDKTTLVLSNTIEFLVQVVYLIYYYSWSVLTTVHPTLNDHVYDMRPICVVHVV